MTPRTGRAALRLALFYLVAASLWAQTEEQSKESQHAKELMAAGKYEQAIPIYQKLVKALPGNTGLVFDLAMAERMAGRDRESVPHFEAVLKAEPKNHEIRSMLADALMSAGRFEQAAAHFRELSSAAPDNPRVWYGLGMAYQGIAGAALERLQKSDAKSPYVAALIADTVVQRRQY